MTTLREGSTARSRASASNVTDIILAADRSVAAEAAQKHVFRRGRKLSAFDSVHRINQPSLCRGKHRGAVLARRKKRRHLPGAAERDVRGFAKRPFPAAMMLQTLLGANSVDRQLQRSRLVGRGRQLVVDQPESAVFEQVESIRHTGERNRPVAARPGEFKLAFQFVLEQPFDYL